MSDRIDLIVPTWRPSGPAAILEETCGRTEATTACVKVDGAPRLSTVIWAVPISGGVAASQTLAEVTGHVYGLAVRADGSAFVFEVDAYDVPASPTRLLLWDAVKGQGRWLTPAEENISSSSPTWSADGSEIFFTRYGSGPGQDPSDLGIWRIHGDGTGMRILRPGLPGALGTHIHGVTPDGEGIVWGRRGLEGASLSIQSISGGPERTFSCCNAYVAAWRDMRPRALVVRHGGDFPDQALVLWDDLMPGVEQELLPSNRGVSGADWDPAGRSIVASVVDAGDPSRAPTLVVLDAQAVIRGTLAGTEGGTGPVWEPEGIVYTQWIAQGNGPKDFPEPRQIRITTDSPATPRTLFQGQGPIRFVTVVR